MRILVTGSAGFIGFHLCKKLIEKKLQVIGFDNINDYYDVNLKTDRLKELKTLANKNKAEFKFIRGDLTNNEDLDKVFNIKNNSNIEYLATKISCVVNLAAQAGVRYSLENPDIYFQSNLAGFFNILENDVLCLKQV